MSVLDNRPENPLKKNYGLRFRIGLAVALFLVCGVFQLKWAVGAGTSSYTAINFDEEPIFIEPPVKVIEETKEVEKVTQKKPVVSEQIDIKVTDKEIVDITDVPDIEVDVTEDVVVEDPVVVAPKVDNKVHNFAEHMPQFPGGQQALLEYLGKTPYCPFALDNDITGTVTVSFVIDKDGTVTSVKIERGVTRCIDDAVVAHIKAMPKWAPGKMGDKPVKVKMGAPIRFSAR